MIESKNEERLLGHQAKGLSGRNGRNGPPLFIPNFFDLYGQRSSNVVGARFIAPLVVPCPTARQARARLQIEHGCSPSTVADRARLQTEHGRNELRPYDEIEQFLIVQVEFF